MTSDGLTGNAALAWAEFRAEFPDAVQTSGKRTLAGQAGAMAENVVSDRGWIAGTYAVSDVSTACQKWVNDNPTARSKVAIAAGLLGVLLGFAPDRVARFSKHLGGLAFDVRVVGGLAGKLMHASLTRLAAKYGGRFIDRENGKAIWHVQF